MTKNKFKTNLKALREIRGFTQEKLASKTKLTRGQVASYEEGRAEPSFDKLKALCKALDTHPSVLIG